MSKHVWVENTKPDRPGIWMRRGLFRPFWVTQDMIDAGLPPRDWCFLMDIPTIVDPPKYRDVTAADDNQLIEVEGVKASCFFVGFSLNGDVVYESEGSVRYETLKRCRILDSGQPKREAREWWIELNGKGGFRAWSERKIDTEHRGEVVHVREVIE